MKKNIYQYSSLVTFENRYKQAGHKGAILWFTGLSGAGKSTLAHAVEKALFDKQCRTYVLDGDNVRNGLCSDLGFSEEDRQENIRRIGEISKLFLQAGIIVLSAFISPYQSGRNHVRQLVKEDAFIEIYCKADLNICEQRDVKGLYVKARRGEIKDFTGISSPYEVPVNPELVLETGTESLETCVKEILAYLTFHALIDM